MKYSNVAKWAIRGLAILTALVALFVSQPLGVILLSIVVIVLAFKPESNTPSSITIPADYLGYALEEAVKDLAVKMRMDQDDVWFEFKRKIRDITINL